MSDLNKSMATETAEASAATQGLGFRRLLSTVGVSPYDSVKEWTRRTASIVDQNGATIFEQKDVEVPADWSATATNIVASKYLHGQTGSPERESSLRQLIGRVVETIRDWGLREGYFKDAETAAVFHDELVCLLLHQYASFNSPVWFNVGCDRLEPKSEAANWHWSKTGGCVEHGRTGYRNPQCSACFINSVKDTMESILTLAKTEGMLFKWGSGTGTNLSALRGSMERLSGGGTASGPLSFMKGFDAFAGVIKSGGKTRRAAKMVILNVDHPDIEKFIECKVKEEAKAHALARVGYDASGPDSEAYSSIFFQNANNSVRVNDEFMDAVIADDSFSVKGVRDKGVRKTYSARKLLHKIAKATWTCGDPGLQYDTVINKWHTSKNSGRINASNPCSEYMFLDDSACNLASLNLMKFARNGSFDVELYKHAIDLLITAQEILVDNSGYPTEAIAQNSHDYRPLGLGYANLGGLLMASGLPYDSDAGRDYAAVLTAILTGEAYLQSSRIAEQCRPIAPAGEQLTVMLAGRPSGGGACPGFYANREPFLDVIRMHRAAVDRIGKGASTNLTEAARRCWDEALAHGEKHGYRNSQVTVLAPTGTIGFMMDCDTTGIEPELALVKFKSLVGGGMIKIVNQTIAPALFKLGYSNDEVDAIVNYIEETGTVEGAPHIREEDLAVFDCSFKPKQGSRTIHWMGHLKMMAAAQPFISGAISKTINMPESATVSDIEQAYVEAWKLGVKAVAIYRDNSKVAQVLTTSEVGKKEEPGRQAEREEVVEEDDMEAPPRAHRHKLPDERLSVTHKFNIGGHEGYITVGLYKNGMPGELFITMAKEGSTISGLVDSFATAVSIALQHGVPLQLLCKKFAHTRFEPSGWSHNPDIGFAKSIMDYIFRWLELRFLTGKQQELFNDLRPRTVAELEAARLEAEEKAADAEAAQGSLDLQAATEAKEPPAPAKVVHASTALGEYVDLGDAPSCPVCGAIMTRNGSCYRCMSCGSTSGCS